MAYDARTVANEFLRCAWERGDSLTNMQLQKLVYIAHGYSLALVDTKLVVQPIQAWRYGPVIPKLYHSLQQYGSGLVTEPIATPSHERLSETFRALISVVESAYGRFSGPQLSTMTHREGTPWRQVYDPKATSTKTIDDELIKQHYLTLLHERAGIKPAQT
jgi:uncharacterized phage-associated protein